MRAMKNNKAVGPDNTPIEIWKCIGEAGTDIVWGLMRKMVSQGEMGSHCRKTSILPLYKEKGDIQQCSKYRASNCYHNTMKVWERILLGRIESETDVSENQFGFIRGRQTSDTIFALRQVMEKYREKQKSLYVAFIDLEKHTTESQG